MKLNPQTLIQATPGRLNRHLNKYLHGSTHHQVDEDVYSKEIQVLGHWNTDKKVMSLDPEVLDLHWETRPQAPFPTTSLNHVLGTTYLITPGKTFYLDEECLLLGAFLHLSAADGKYTLDVVLDFDNDAHDLWGVSYQIDPTFQTYADFIQHNLKHLEEEQVPGGYLPDHHKQLPTIASLLAVLCTSVSPVLPPEKVLA